MLKQIISPQYFSKDIANSRMHACFFDKTAKRKIYIYKTNQVFEEMFFDDESSSTQQRIINYAFFKEVNIWVAQDFSKQSTMIQQASLAKTIAYSSEIEFFSKENMQSNFKSTLYFFTFEPINANAKVEKFIFKEYTNNLDKENFRFVKVKALQLNSLLIKNYKFWFFQESINTNRTKIKSMKIKYPAAVFMGVVNIKGSSNPILVPQEVEWTLKAIVHPFEALEPVCLNFNFANSILGIQLMNFDALGKAIEKVNNIEIGGVGHLTQGTCDYFDKSTFGLETYMPGVPGVRRAEGLCDHYMVMCKDADASFKQYFWNYQAFDQTLVWSARTYIAVFKRNSVSSIKQIESCLKNSYPNFPYSWNGSSDDRVGTPFYSFSLKMLNSENFEISNQLSYNGSGVSSCFGICGQLNLGYGIIQRRPPHWSHLPGNWMDGTWYLNNETLPWGFSSTSKMRKIINQLRFDKNINYIMVELELDEPKYLNEIEVNSILADELEFELIDINDQKIHYNVYTSFFLIRQDECSTRISFA